MAVILRSRCVVPVSSAPIENGAVVVEGERIAAVGKWEDLRATHAGEVIDLGERLLMPGLINAHCHLDYTMMRWAISRQRSFTEWIRRINALKRSLSDDEYLTAIVRGFAQLRKWGTTTVANIESFPELLVRMPPPPIRTWWFCEMIDIRHRNASEEAVAGALAFFTPREGWIGGFGLSPHAPYTASASLYELVGKAAEELRMPVTTHVAESREEWDMFRHGRGELHDFMATLGRWMHDCRHGRTPLAHLAVNTQITDRWLLAHMNELDEDDFAWLARRPSADRPSIVHCPGSHQYFGHAPFPLARLRDAGVNICLGTDSLASTDTLSLFDEMRKLAQNQPQLRADEIVAMATANGAQALGIAAGRLQAGALADLIALPFSGEGNRVHEAILAHHEPVTWMMVNGQVPSEN
jgi:cytosine/adenosine deaminase-related metal-dependent hydrolase